MRVEKFVAKEKVKLSDFILSNSLISYNSFQKVLRNKDVKVNGIRCSKDKIIDIGDEVLIYIPDEKKLSEQIIYQDDNILIVNKPRGIETVSENSDEITLHTKISQEIGDCFAVHRLDRNTSGLVVFAKNIKSKKILDDAIKKRKIDKFYLALVYGTFDKKEDLLEAYLKKDEKKSLVYVSDVQEDGFVNIKTKYRVLESYEKSSLIEVELITGKTHQIRAHFAHIGHFLIGDEKYGDSKINKLFKKKYQCLTSFKIKFHFDKNSVLSYLDGKEFVLPKEKVDFLSKNK